jgi:hypothetical protein
MAFTGIENVELEFAEMLEAGKGLQFADGREGINFPQRLWMVSELPTMPECCCNEKMSY